MSERSDHSPELDSFDAETVPATTNAETVPADSASVDAEFALLLTHDVDRPYKTYQSIYYAIERRDPRQLKSLLPGVNPWWQFEEIQDLESSLGVRSAFYFLREPHLLERPATDWFDPFYWVEHLGRYEVETPELLDVLDDLRDGGWEVGLHGSYDSYDDPDRLEMEKTMLELALGDEVRGSRQHHLNRGPEAWDHQRELGLKYDASLGSSSEYGFDHGYRPLRPFGDEFVVFPLTLMETALPDPSEEFETAWSVCEDLLETAAQNDAVMSVLWHPRLFCEADFPGYRQLYQQLVERALEMGAWVGPPGEYYDLLDHPHPQSESAATESESRRSGSANASERVAGSVGRTDLNSEHEDRHSEQGDDNKVPTHRTDPTG